MQNIPENYNEGFDDAAKLSDFDGFDRLWGKCAWSYFFLYGTAGRKLKYDAGVGNHFACGRIFHSTTAARFIFPHCDEWNGGKR